MTQARSTLIVEDNDAGREWLAECVASAFPNTAVTTAATFAEARAVLEKSWMRAAAHGRSAAIDLALVDIGLPDGSGIDLIAAISENDPACLTIVTTIYDDDDHIFRAIEAGASGYLLKLHETPRLIELLRRILDGEPPMSPSIARRMLAVLQQRAQRQMASAAEAFLTPRETEVLGLLGRGFQLAQVASHLAISRNTASSHVKSIYRKLNVSNRAEATLAAVDRGLVDRT